MAEFVQQVETRRLHRAAAAITRLLEAVGPPPEDQQRPLPAARSAHQISDERLVLDREAAAAGRRQLKCVADGEPTRRCVEQLDASPDRLTLGDALELSALGRGRLSVKGKSFIRELVCGPCRRQRSLLVLGGRADRLQQTCDGCGRPMEAAGFSLLDHLSHDVLSPPALGLSLASIGFRPGDVFSLECGGREVHYEIGGSA